MTADNVAALAVSFLLLIYLIAALVVPERF